MSQRIDRIPRALLGLLIVLLLTEGLVSSPWFRELPLTENGGVRKGRWLAGQAPAGCLILGDSTAHRGIDAEKFGAALGVRTLNAAFTSGTPIVERSVLGQFSWRPETLVFAMSPLLLADNWPMQPHEAVVATLGERIGLQGLGEGLVGGVWRAYGHRQGLNEARVLAQGKALSAEPFREDGFGSLPVATDGGPSEAEARELLGRWLPKGTPQLGVRSTAMLALANEWRMGGQQVTYVWMPVASDLRRLIRERGADDFRLAALQDVTRIPGARVLDCLDALPDEAFYDSDHLKVGPWRDRFSVALAEAVRTKAESCPRLN